MIEFLREALQNEVGQEKPILTFHTLSPEDLA